MLSVNLTCSYCINLFIDCWANFESDICVGFVSMNDEWDEPINFLFNSDICIKVMPAS